MKLKPLIQLSGRQIDVPRTGETLSIDLATERTGKGNLQVTSWIVNSKRRPFDWRYLLSIPGGGLVEREGQFDFEAPADGYQRAIEVNMSASANRGLRGLRDSNLQGLLTADMHASRFGFTQGVATS